MTNEAISTKSPTDATGDTESRHPYDEVVSFPDHYFRAPQLPQALAEAQGEFPDIPKNRVAKVRTKTGGEFKFNYADLSDVLRAVRAPLAKHGLSVTQSIKDDEVTTVLRHSSGEELVGLYPIHHKPEGRMNASQEYAISVQYARRYGLCALLCISADESRQDDKASRMVSEKFEDEERDGVVGVKGAAYDPKKTPAENAAAYAEAIIKQFGEAKKEEGLNGVWDRNVKVIDRLQDSYPSEYANLLDAYELRGREIRGD